LIAKGDMNLPRESLKFSYKSCLIEAFCLASECQLDKAGAGCAGDSTRSYSGTVLGVCRSAQEHSKRAEDKDRRLPWCSETAE
jgi:hypothetical protein